MESLTCLPIRTQPTAVHLTSVRQEQGVVLATHHLDKPTQGLVSGREIIGLSQYVSLMYRKHIVLIQSQYNMLSFVKLSMFIQYSPSDTRLLFNN